MCEYLDSAGNANTFSSTSELQIIVLELLRISVFVSFFHLGKPINLQMVNPGSVLWSHVTRYELLLAVEGLWELLRISVFVSLSS